jgi:phosphate transport system protein
VSEQRQEFENALENIESKVIELFAMVGEDLPSATRALLNCDGEALTALIARDREIDALYPELERSHDLVVHIAARANRIFTGDLSARASGLVEAMGALAAGMWRTAADAWYQRDGSAAQSLMERDEEMDDLHASLIAELASGQMSVPVTMEMTLAARDYERLGAHAVNIARRVIYLAGSGAIPNPGPTTE